MAIKSLKLACDFETTTDPNDTRVWAGCAVDIDSLEIAFIGNTIDAFFQWLSDKNTVCYFHNLKFDGEFILSYLLNNGYKFSEKHENKTFDVLITDTGLFYSITVIFEKKNKKYKKVTFYDSLKKLPFKVSQISKAFNLEDEKLVIDYKAKREIGHELTQEEKDYIRNDCRIVANALQIQLSKGLKRMTIASDALNEYKRIIGKDNFERWFPTLPIELDADIRRAYKGGFVYLKPVHKDDRGLKGITLDINSLYPWVMYTCLLPYGYPMYFEGEPTPDERYNLFIVRILARFKVKKDHLPTIQLKNSNRFVQTEYITDSRTYDKSGVLIDEPVELVLTSVDLALFLDHYDIFDIEYKEGWKFKGAHGMFKDYIDYWMHIKETSTGAMRQLAKLMLNSLYGKFATNPKSQKKRPYLDEDGIVRYVLDEPELKDPIYTAMGAFITAYAREKTIRSGQSVYDRYIYSDTDSLHLIGWEIPENLEIHPTKLGAWKHEGTFIDSKYIRAKTYMETMYEEKDASLKTYAKLLNGAKEQSLKDYVTGQVFYTVDFERIDDMIKTYRTIVTCAGMPDNVKESVTYDNFASGSTFDGKLMPKRVKGGIVLIETTFTIK